MNLKNGKDVEQLVAGIYLNDMCLDRGNALVEEMAKKREDIKTAFTYLILAWMEVLSKMEYYDARMRMRYSWQKRSMTVRCSFQRLS